MKWFAPFMSGEEIYRNFQEGFGPGGLAASAEIVNTSVGRYQERVDRILKLRARMEAAWQGSAADAADRGLGPLVIEHGLAGRALHVAQDLTSRQVGSFVEAKHAVVPVPPAPDVVDPLAMLVDPAVAATHLRQVELHSQAAQHNVDVMYGYTGASQYNTDGQPTSYGQITDGPAGIGIDVRPDAEGDQESIQSDVDGWLALGQDPVSGTEADGNGSPEAAQENDPVPNAALPPGATEPAADSILPPAMGPTDTVPSNTVPASAVPTNGFGVPSSEALEGGPRHGGLNGNGAGGSGSAGGLLGGGRGGSATQPGISARPMVIASGPGRGGVGFAGLPAPAGTRREEDTERKTPGYLDGGDPEELWDTDELTAPPAIGDEDG